MSIILGIFDGTHDAGACIVQDGRVIAACDEERWTRKKGQGGFPTHSVNWCLKHSDLSWSDIDRIAMAGWINPNPVLRLFRSQQSNWKLDNNQFYAPDKWWSNWIQFRSPFPKMIPKSNLAWKLYKRCVHTGLRRQLSIRLTETLPPLDIYEHHKSHAASALFASGHTDALTLVADGVGDGLALSIWKTETSTQSKHLLLTNCLNIPFPHSLGLFYASITGYLGYKPFRHEGKITGLSARGNADHIDVSFPFIGPFPHRRLSTDFPLYDWLKRLNQYSPEDIAAWLQKGIEEEIIGIVRWAQVQFGNRPLVMAGGLMANVALNAQISTQLKPPDLFVFPNMGDAGLAVGAAYLCGQSHFDWSPSEVSKIPSVYWGPKIDCSPQNFSLQKLSTYNVSHHTESELIDKAVTALKAGKIIARAAGRMEYGPRALGNRSILCSARDPSIHQKLNSLLNRSDIMPFAPVMRFENASSWLNIPSSSWTAMDWMTITVQAKANFTEKCPAVVHVDNSLRPQLVHKERQPTLWQLLKEFEDHTGEPALINTSFNRHEEPIVCTATDAIRAFEASGLDALWLDQWWIERK